MYYYMELPDTKQDTLNKAYTYILSRFTHLNDGLYRCMPAQQQLLINNYPVHSLRWSSEGPWLGWGGTRLSYEELVPFPEEKFVIGEL